MRINQVCGGLLLVCWALFARSSLQSAEPDKLAGRHVIACRPQAAIYEKPARGSELPDASAFAVIAFIHEVRGEWVRSDEGWLLAEDVVDVDDARDFFTKSIEASPTAFAYASRAWVRILSSEPIGEALTDAEEAVRRDPNCALAFFVKAHCNFSKRVYHEALPDFTRAVELEPRFKSACHDRALCANQCGRHAEAKDYIEAALNCWPNEPGLVEVRGIINRDKGEYDEAIADFLSVQEAKPSERAARHLALTYRARGELRLTQQQFELAIADLTEAIKLDPKITYAYRHRGEGYLRLRQFLAAIDDLKEAVRQTPESASARAMLGHALLELGKIDEAISQLNESLRLQDGAPEVLGLRGRAWCFRGKHGEAARDFERAIELNPSFAWIHAALGNSLVALGKFDRAIDELSRAIDLEPKNGEWRRLRGFALGSRALVKGAQEDFDRAISDCSAAIELAPTSADAYYTRGMLFSFKQQHEQAIADLTGAIAIDPFCFHAYDMRASEWLDLHAPARAIEDLTESLRVSPGRPDAYLERSKAWSLAGNQQQAAEDAAEAERLEAQLAESAKDEKRR